MRIFPLVLITIGTFGVLNHYGLIDPDFVHLLWPVLLIAIGLAMLARGPRWRADMRDRAQDRWERRMHRHFGPGWANLSDDERERFRAGMRQWRRQFQGGGDPRASEPMGPSEASPPHATARPPGADEPR